MKSEPRLRFAGQITGCEGYVESAAIGLLAGRFAAAERLSQPIALPPPNTAHGALLAHITGSHVTGSHVTCSHLDTADPASESARSYQPMNINFGLFPPLSARLKNESGERLRGTEKSLARKRALTRRALDDLDGWIAGELPVAAE
jgi:methylenetetrahydrofolate--tRNA-(uracil-5-)-methyltransferase